MVSERHRLDGKGKKRETGGANQMVAVGPLTLRFERLRGWQMKNKKKLISHNSLPWMRLAAVTQT